MSLIKKSIVLFKDKAKGLINFIRLGDTVGAKLQLNENPLKALWAAIKIGQNPQIHIPIKPQSQYSFDIDLKITDNIGVVIMDVDNNIYALGGLKDMVNTNSLKKAIEEGLTELKELTKSEQSFKRVEAESVPVFAENIINKETKNDELAKEKEANPVPLIPIEEESVEVIEETPVKVEEIAVKEAEPVKTATENIHPTNIVENALKLIKAASDAVNKDEIPLNEQTVAVEVINQTVEEPIKEASIDESVNEATTCELQKKNFNEPKQEGQEDMPNSYERAKEAMRIKQQQMNAKNEKPSPFDIPKDVNFYQSIRNRLDEIIMVNPREENLEKIIPDSKWVKVKYDKEDYYVVGVLTEEGSISHIAYGVPGMANVKPPKEAEELCDFLPVQNPMGEGYWLMFQDAKDGTIIKN